MRHAAPRAFAAAREMGTGAPSRWGADASRGAAAAAESPWLRTVADIMAAAATECRLHRHSPMGRTTFSPPPR